MSFEWLITPLEEFDAGLTTLFNGAPLIAALGIALLLGLRHASDPDHLVAISTLVVADGRGIRDARNLGAWWGVGHACTLLAVGVPLILIKSEMPTVVEANAERAVGAVLVVLALLVIVKWVRGGYASQPHSHRASGAETQTHTHLHAGATEHRHIHSGSRQALGIGMLHGLAGTGAVVVLLIAALPSQFEALLTLVVFAPATVVSMTAFSSAWAWVLTRSVAAPLIQPALVPALGLFGFAFGLWYVSA